MMNITIIKINTINFKIKYFYKHTDHKYGQIGLTCYLTDKEHYTAQLQRYKIYTIIKVIYLTLKKYKDLYINNKLIKVFFLKN